MAETALHCLECNDTLWVQREKGLSQCVCLVERRVRRALPPRFHDARLETLPPAQHQAVTTWLQCEGDGLLLSGPAGTGKTWAAAALTRHLIEADCGILWRTTSEFFRTIRETYTQGSAEGAILKECATPKYLVLDDLGAGAGSDFERRCALELIELRINQLVPTIVTTNLTMKEIAERFDERLASRLSLFARMDFTGQDLRLKRRSA